MSLSEMKIYALQIKTAYMEVITNVFLNTTYRKKILKVS